MQDRERASSRRLGCHFWTPSSLRWNHKVSLFSLQSLFFFFVNVCHTQPQCIQYTISLIIFWKREIVSSKQNFIIYLKSCLDDAAVSYRAHTGIIKNDIFFSSSSFIFILFCFCPIFTVFSLYYVLSLRFYTFMLKMKLVFFFFWRLYITYTCPHAQREWILRNYKVIFITFCPLCSYFLICF